MTDFGPTSRMLVEAEDRAHLALVAFDPFLHDGALQPIMEYASPAAFDALRSDLWALMVGSHSTRDGWAR